ncbi:trehalase family glycosidase [Mesorhizobium sp. M0145]|uniref:trehalase family glycosidase n=1 Tax=unclassified Mesorhizobium TaxID=325217 RepID=UPI003338C14E
MEILDYIEAYWPRIVRNVPVDQGTLIGLPRPYMASAEDPIFQEMFYWDSYFTAVGLSGTPREQLIVDMAENMVAMLRRFGMIPNASRLYFLSRSQPPLSTAMFRLAFETKEARGDPDACAFLAEAMSLAALEHRNVWLGEIHPHIRRVHAGLSRYFDANYTDELASFESGWDRSTRCQNRWLDHLPICLNSVLYLREIDLEWASRRLGDDESANAWRSAADARAASVRDLMWDETAGLFFDFDYVAGERDGVATLAAFFPLWSGLASQSEADRMVGEWLPKFSQPGGLVTSLAARDGHQWAWPNGWAPLQWIVVAGLERYGFREEAMLIMRTWWDTCVLSFEKTGAMWEKYNVVEVGAPPVDDRYGSVGGFGWTNAVFLDFHRRLGDAKKDVRAPKPQPAISSA